MYLLLVDHEFISSAVFQEVIDKVPEGTDIINCFSASTLLKVTKNLSPDLVIVDLAMAKDDLAGLFNELRSKSKGTYIMVLLNPDYYDQLYEAIEIGGIDDYLVKPIRNEDFLARIHIATRKSEYDRQGYQSKPCFHEDESEEPESKDSEKFDEDLTGQKHDCFSTEDESISGLEDESYGLFDDYSGGENDQEMESSLDVLGLFDDIPSRTEESSDGYKEEESTFPEVEETLPSESPLQGEEQENESRRETLRSQLPGKSADDFLFGKDPDEEQEQSQDDDQVYNQEMLNQFTEEEDTPEEETSKRVRAREKNGSRKRFPKIFSVFGNIIFVILLLIMAVLSFSLIQSRITGGVPQVAGYQIYIVLSGSMQPEFDTGSLAFVRETDPEALTAGDIITFRSPVNPDSLTTHRIVEVQDGDELQFVTRGDANNVNDPNPVPTENVVGKVTGSVPYAGYLMNFVLTSQGLILLIFVPGVLIIVFELGKIMKYLTQGDEKIKKPQRY